MRISINVRHEGRAIEEMLQKCRTLRKPVAESGRYMRDETKNNFSSQSDPDGAAWAGLRPSTLKQKKGGRILTRSGALAGSVRLRSGGLTATVSVGTSYAQYHQNGTSKMVQRKVIGIGDRHIPKIKQFFEDHLNG